MNIAIGQAVVSKRGRDAGKPFVVLDVFGEYLFLADGDSRLIAKPKKKKDRHVQPVNKFFDFSSVAGRKLNDADIRKYIKNEICKKGEV